MTDGRNGRDGGRLSFFHFLPTAVRSAGKEAADRNLGLDDVTEEVIKRTSLSVTFNGRHQVYRGCLSQKV